MKKMKIKVFYLFFLIFSGTKGQVGNNCKIQHTGFSGTCKLTNDCPQAKRYADIGIKPTICGYQYNTPIVCCEGQIEANENSFLNLDYSTSSSVPDLVYPTDDREDQVNSNGKTMADHKCGEYSKYVNKELQFLPLDVHGVPATINVTKCDFDSLPLIVGGKPASVGEFPHQAAIGFRNTENEIQFLCGGTLISERFVLTAGHCTFERTFGAPIKVRLGATNLINTVQGENAVDINIDRIIKHPNYRSTQKYDDISLLKLERNVVFNQKIRPACLWTKSHNRLPNTAVATGWGLQENAGVASDKLLKVALNVFPNSECDRTYPTGSKGLPTGISDSMLCAGDLKGGKDTCQGDSGGPLQISKDTNQCVFYLIGITSFGKACAFKNTPAVYTRVSSYIDWISNIVWSEYEN